MALRKTHAVPATPEHALELLARAQPQETAGAWHYDCTLATPMYGGGVEAGDVDCAMPIRATAIRGQLRHWWRLLHGKDEHGKARSPQKLFEIERDLWGGLGDAQTLAASKVLVEVKASQVPDNKLQAIARFEQRDGKLKGPFVATGLPAYALFPGQGRSEKGEVAEQPGKLLMDDFRFQLVVRFDRKASEEQRQQVEQALRWWATFGGVGARTRRGCGAVMVTDAKHRLIRVAENEVAKHGLKLVVRADAPGDAIKAWNQAIDKLKKFRQGENSGRNQGTEKNRPGRSRWPEPDAIRRITSASAPAHANPVCDVGDVFPRAMFGLPIIFHFKDKNDPQDTTLKPVPDGQTESAERMASPLILRPYPTADGHWQAAALLLDTRHADAMGLSLEGPFRASPRKMARDAWKPKADAVTKIRPLDGKADAIDAFLAFFAADGVVAGQQAAALAPAASTRPKVATGVAGVKLTVQGNGALKAVHPKSNGSWNALADKVDALLAGLTGPHRQRLKPGSGGFVMCDIEVVGSEIIAVRERMSTWLVEIAFGPVQGYIAAARRSRDLWAGSRLLSEVVRAAGVALLDGGAELIYPLASRVRGEHADEDSNLSNVLLAQVEADSPDAVARLTRAAQEAGRQRLLESADGALASWRQAGVALREDIWQRQAADALECFAGWCRSDGDYKRAYEHTKVALGARKKTRDFAPMFAGPDAQLGLGIPKSSLDGLRESVLPKGRARFPPKFGVAPGEQLDTLGCIKRVAGRSERFTALTRMAADGWLQGLAPNEIAGLNTACERLVPAGLATRSEGNGGIYASFPYDAGLLYPERLEAAVAQARAAAKDDVALLESFASVLRPLWKKHGRPCPYAAIVVADGDRMGRFIDKAASAAQHTQISAAIADFADEVPDVCRQHRGHSIYNGGEDVMALFPLADLVHGCRALAERFDERMRGVVVELLGKSPPPGDRPSLRVGAAICHVLEPLGLIRAYGDAAEKFAKGDAGSDAQGNALGLHLHTRGGHVVAWRARFDAPDEFARLEAWRTAFIDGSMPGKLPYRIRQAWLAGRESGLDAEVIHCEIRRTITHANERGGGDAIQAGLTDALQARARQFARAGDPTGYGQLIDELILARWLAARSASDLGREGT